MWIITYCNFYSWISRFFTAVAAYTIYVCCVFYFSKAHKNLTFDFEELWEAEAQSTKWRIRIERGRDKGNATLYVGLLADDVIQSNLLWKEKSESSNFTNEGKKQKNKTLFN